MSATSTIEWTNATWNPVTGCTKVSPGCDHCYAETFAERFHGTPGHYFERGFDVQLRPEKLDLPLRWRKPKRIFVNSMSDLFHKDIPDDYIASVFAVMAVTERHTFQILTKRHARMRALLNSKEFRERVRSTIYVNASEVHEHWFEYVDFSWPLPNVWLGVSVEDQQWAGIRIPILLDTPAAVRWISAEPLLGAIDVTDYLTCQDDRFGHECSGCWLDWVVVGGESGPGARPMHPDWARALRDQCAAARIPFLFKQRGAWTWERPERITARHQYGPDMIGPDGKGVVYAHRNRRGVIEMWMVGKKAAGRELDGRIHDGYPRQERVA